MQRITCQACQAPLAWDGTSEIVTCAYCGTRYRMHPRQRDEDAAGVTVGQGRVSAIQTSQGMYASTPLVKSFVPMGYTVQTNAPEQQSNLLNPLVLEVSYASPNKDVFITYTGTRGFNHIDPTPQNAPLQGQIQSDMMVALSYRDAAGICDMVLASNPNVSDVRLTGACDEADAFARQKMDQAIRSCASANLLNPGASWTRKQAQVTDSTGQVWHKAVEAMVFYGFIPVSQEEQMAYQLMLQSQQRLMMNMGGFGGLMGGLMAGLAGAAQPQVAPPQPKLRWSVDWVLETSATAGALDEAMEAHERIRTTMETLPAFQREFSRILDLLVRQRIQADQAAADALGQMNRDQMASWDRRSQIIRDASDHANAVMHDMWASNDATMNRVRNLQSETIREQNTFYTTNPGFGVPDVIEASTQYDHLYQNTRHPDEFLGTFGDAPLEYGTDFEELKPTEGNY